MQIEAEELIRIVLGQLPKHQTEKELFWIVGKKYFIRTVTHHQTGVFLGFSSDRMEVLMGEAAWIADDGRLTEALATGNFNEVEMFPSVGPTAIGRTSIVDAVQILNIPTSQK